MSDSPRPEQDENLDAETEVLAGGADPEEEASVSEEGAGSDGAEANEETMEVSAVVDTLSTCERSVTVTVPRDEIERYYDKEFSSLVDKAEVPGFRTGHAPRKLVEKRYRKEIKDQIKSQIIQDGIAQVIENESLAAIGEPEFDFDAVILPDEGPMTFEFNLEVRPQFDLPQWKGLKLRRFFRDFTDKDVDAAVDRIRANHGRLVPFDGPAEPGDYIVTRLICKHEDTVLSQADEETIRLKENLSFHDGEIEGFAEKMTGVTAGQARECELVLSDSAPNEALRGQRVTAIFEVLEVKRLDIPEMNEQFIAQLGLDSEAELRDLILDRLRSQFEYELRQSIRRQVVAKLTESADWELPPTLLRRQANRELHRAVLELRRSGFSEDDIREHENLLRRNSMQTTETALKEHFILERIAEEEEISVTEADVELEMAEIARKEGENIRRVRRRIEREGLQDIVRNQVLERKTIDLVVQHAVFEDVPYEAKDSSVEAVDQAIGGGERPNIPEAVEDEGGESKTKESR